MTRKKHIKLANKHSGEIVLESARWCDSRWCKFLGYQFRFNLDDGEALLFVHNKETVRGSSIHMFFVFTSLTVAWLNDQGRVTHVELARPWRPYYGSPTPARYVLETTPDLIDRIKVGDELEIIDR